MQFYKEPEFKRYIAESIFKEDGWIAENTTGYKVRPSQKDAAEKLASAISEDKHAIIEGPCGFGKTYVYLTSAILKALDNYKDYESNPKERPKVLIVTNGISLQEQLCEKDLPFMIDKVMNLVPESEYKIRDGHKVTYALFKGRQNFICPLKFNINQEAVQSLLPASQFEEMRNLNTSSGDLNRLSFIPSQDILALSVCQTQNECKRRKCPMYNECHYVAQKNDAYLADIIVCNYHMLFSSVEAPVLPFSNLIIWDEAHEATQIFRNFNIENLSEFWSVKTANDLKKIVKTSYGLRQAMESADQTLFHKSDKEIEAGFAQAFRSTISAYLSHVARLCGINMSSNFEDTRLLLDNMLCDEKEKGLRHEILQYMRSLQEFAKNLMNRVASDLETPDLIPDYEREEIEVCYDTASELSASLEKRIQLLCRKEQELMDYAYYVKKSVRRDGERTLHLERMPVQVGPLIKQLFLDTHQSIFTSATLSTGGNLNFFKKEVGLDLCEPDSLMEFIGESPFNLQQQELWYLPDICVEGNKPDFDDYFLNTVLTLYNIKKGGMLVLTTSISAMNRTHASIREYLISTDRETLLLKQGDMPRGKLIDAFKEDGGAILVATKSFFTGIDIPGSALQCLVIDKLPFDSPNDPVTMHLNCTTQNCFFSYSIPKMIITLKQAVGRGVRSVTDKCLVCIADSRIATARYSGTIGRSFNYTKTSTRDLDKVMEFFEK